MNKVIHVYIMVVIYNVIFVISPQPNPQFRRPCNVFKSVRSMCPCYTSHTVDHTQWITHSGSHTVHTKYH